MGDAGWVIEGAGQGGGLNNSIPPTDLLHDKDHDNKQPS